jgi:hypothetical protein
MAAYRFAVRREVERWRHEQDMGEPRLMRTDDGSAVILDSRPGAKARIRALDPLDRLLVERCDEICTRDRLLALMRGPTGAGARSTTLDDRLRRLAEERLLVASGDSYLSLALPPLGGSKDSSAEETVAEAPLTPSRARIS